MGQKLLFIILFLSFWAHGQNSDLMFKNITIDDGLSQNSIVDIAQDRLGFMWFATQDGLNRFDGQNFKVFPEIFDDITSPNYSQLGKLHASGNKLWFVSKGGNLKVLDLCTENIYPIERLGMEMEDLPPVSTLHEDGDGNLWIGTFDQGVYRWNSNRNSFTAYTENKELLNSLAGNHVQSIFEDSENNIWVLSNNGITKIGADNTRNYLHGINTNVLTQDLQGNLWLGTFGEGLFKMEPGAGNFEIVKQFGQDEMPGDLVIEAIHADSVGNVWIGTYGNGLYILNKELEKVFHYMPERRNHFSLGFQDILSIKEDHQGAIWVGTDGGGLSYYNAHFHNFKRLTGEDVPEEISIRQIRAIATDKENGIWLGTSGKGLTYLSPDLNEAKTFDLKPYKPGISNYNRIVSLLVDNEGDLWVGTHGNGLLLKDRKTGKIKKWFFSSPSSREYIPDNTIWAMIKAGPRRIFAATRNAGVLLLDKDTGFVKSFPTGKDSEDSIEKKNIRDIIKVNDSILALGSEDGGIYLLNIFNDNYEPLTNPIIEETLNEEVGIKSLFYNQDYLWAGTAGKGLLVTHLKTGKTTSITPAQGLPNGMIYGIVPEGEKTIWLSSNKGLIRLNYHLSDRAVVVQKIQSYTVEDGLQSNEFNTGAYHISDNGKIYFGGINGLNFFDPKEILNTRENREVVLTGAMVENNPLQTDSLITYKSHVRLPYNKNSISFNYTILDFLSPETMNYEYILEGYEEQWVQAGKRQYTAYTNLPPGDYTFKVRPAENIISNATPASLGISISAPFWMKWWFFILVFLFISGALYLFYKYRINQLLEVQRVKNNISADLHDDIGSRLTSIHFLSAISKQKILLNGEAKQFLEGIDEEVQASAEALNEIVWNIKMDDESLEDIVAKMRRYAGEAFDTSEIKYSVEIDSEFSGRKMEMQKRREIFLIFKELLNNVRKHAKAKMVKIEISIRENMFYMAVGDNGEGFDPSRKTSRNGIKNTKERIDKWKGKMKISSTFLQGSLVEIWLPFDRHSVLRRIFGTLKKTE